MAMTKRKLMEVLDRLMEVVGEKNNIKAAGTAVRKSGEVLWFATGGEAGVLDGN